MKQCNPLMAQLMRGSQSSSPVFARSVQMTARGGGGSWHRPDPKPYALYKYTRRYHLEDINSVLYSDFAPEFHMHLHSMWVQSSKQGLFLWFSYFFLIICPVWLFARYLMKKSGAGLFPAVGAGDQHAHMAPAIISHLKSNNCEKAEDKFGRQNAQFYTNWVRQDQVMKRSIHTQLDKHF